MDTIYFIIFVIHHVRLLIWYVIYTKGITSYRGNVDLRKEVCLYLIYLNMLVNVNRKRDK